MQILITMYLAMMIKLFRNKGLYQASFKISFGRRKCVKNYNIRINAYFIAVASFDNAF